MPIIRGLIKSSKTTKNQITRWRKRRIIPRQVLNTIWWEFGIKIESEPPKTGMGLKRFLELIWQIGLSEQDNETRAAALFIYQDTVKSELMPNWKFKVRAKKPRIVWPEKKDKKITLTTE
jgi:hypothetical protein